MESKSLFVLPLATLLGLCLSIRGADSISCYTCSGNLTTEVGKACADLSNIQPTSGHGHCYVRTVVAESIREDVPVYIQRGGDPLTVTSNCDFQQCSCITENCNNQKVKVPYLTCYECTTSEMISNGCGDDGDFSEASIFVKKISGCHACTKLTMPGGQIVRGCAYSSLAKNKCESDNRGTHCYCTGSLCNSAPSLLTTPTRILLLSLITVLTGIMFS